MKTEYALKRAIAGLAVLAILWSGCAKKKNANEPLAIVGSGAVEQILMRLAEAYSKTTPGCEITVSQSIGSSGGINAVGNDEYILGRVSRPIKDSEAHFGLSYTPFARDMIIFAVGGSVTIDSLTEAQIIDIYAGKIDNWGRIGGENAPIRALTREKGETSREMIEKHFPAFRELELDDRIKLTYHDYEMADALIRYPTAIGFLTSSSLKQGFKPISFNGISPVRENLLSGKYPFVSEYAFIYKQKRLNDAAKRFIDFVLSDEGKRILESNGLTPVETEQ